MKCRHPEKSKREITYQDAFYGTRLAGIWCSKCGSFKAATHSHIRSTESSGYKAEEKHVWLTPKENMGP